MQSIVERMKSGQPARLIPGISDSKKEERATSILLALFSVVPDFAKEILAQVGVNIGKRTEILCFTEVVFRDVAKNLRPDGLIVVRNGSKEWSAIVESKIGTTMLKQDQLEDYISLCRELDANALITISNQYAIKPDHHPLLIPRKHLKFIDVAHFSWLSVMSQALLAISEHWVSDVEQSFMLKEFIRYLEDDASGVSKNVKLSATWADVVARVQLGEKLRRCSEVEETVAGWHQVLRFATIQLTMDTGRLVSLVMTRQRQRDPDANFKADVDQLIANNFLSAELEVPGAASRFTVKADFLRRTIELSTRMTAPSDRSRPTSPINWFIKQIQDAQEIDPIVRVFWPRSSLPTVLPLSEINQPSDLIPNDKKKQLPVAFEAAWVIDLGGRFKGRNTFVDDLTGAIPRFYRAVLENLKAWVPPSTSSARTTVKPSQDTPLPETVLALPPPPEKPSPVPQVVRILPTAGRRRYLDDRYN